MPAATTTTLAEAIARNIAARRRASTDVLTGEPLSQAGLARDMAVTVGLPFTQSTVAAIETGRRHVSAVELVALSMVLRAPISALLDPGDASAVEISDGTYWRPDNLRRVARGDVDDLDEDTGFGTSPQGDEMMRDAFRMIAVLGPVAERQLAEFEERWGLDPSSMSARQHRSIAYADGEVEREATVRIRRACRRLPRFEPREVAGAAWKLWKRSYAEERDRRLDAQAAPDASDRTRVALRGHVVRQLDRELLDEMIRVLGTVERKKRRS